MNTGHALKLHAILPALALQALLPVSAIAATLDVRVVNAPAAAVPVTGTINAYPAAQVLSPYQVQQSISDSSTCSPQCIVSFPAVPSGQRLVVTNVSAQLGQSADIVVIEGNNSTFFVPKPYPTSSYLAVPVTVYFEPGSTPTARMFVPDATQHTSLIVTFAGYLVPLH